MERQRPYSPLQVQDDDLEDLEDEEEDDRDDEDEEADVENDDEDGGEEPWQVDATA